MVLSLPVPTGRGQDWPQDDDVVVKNVYTGADPDVLGHHVGKRKHEAGGPDNEQALQNVPLVGRQVRQAEQHRRNQPSREDRGLPGPLQSREAKGEDGQERQNGNEFLAKELDGYLYREDSQFTQIHTAGRSNSFVWRRTEELRDQESDHEGNDQVENGEEDHPENVPTSDFPENSGPVAGGHDFQAEQRNGEEEDDLQKLAEGILKKRDRHHQQSEPDDDH